MLADIAPYSVTYTGTPVTMLCSLTRSGVITCITTSTEVAEIAHRVCMSKCHAAKHRWRQDEPGSPLDSLKRAVLILYVDRIVIQAFRGVELDSRLLPEDTWYNQLLHRGISHSESIIGDCSFWQRMRLRSWLSYRSVYLSFDTLVFTKVVCIVVL